MKFLIAIITLIIFEIFIKISVKKIKKKFQWFIEKKDEFPNFNLDKFNNYIKNSFDKDLGWIRKAGSNGFDNSGIRKIKFNIDRDGTRKSNFKKKKPLVATFGDSYVFCKEVEDRYTWQEIISKNKDYRVLNYGLGNYGLDQAIIKYEKLKLKTTVKVVILGVVPETICRIQSQWKHFLEFGNINGFKPKFFLKKNKLYLIKNPLSKKTQIRNIKKIIKKLKKTDRFYEDKFKKIMFRFPYSLSFFRNIKLNLKIFYIYFFEKKNQSNLFMYEVMKHNICYAHKLYNEKYSQKLFIRLIEKYKKIANSRGHIPLLIIMPQLLDIKKTTTSRYYKEFFKTTVSKKIDILDLTVNFEKRNNINFFTNRFYGSHLSKLGNKFISNDIEKFLDKYKNYLK